MKDTILRGTGNSRTLRSVSNFLTLYPTYNAFAQALVQGTLPIDIGALNSAGLTTRGTDLNKPNILTDATATGIGLTSSATPNDAFAKLAALVKAAQDDADTALSAGISIQTGSYTGDGTKEKTIAFSRPWHLFVVAALGGRSSPGIVFRDAMAVTFADYKSTRPSFVRIGQTSTDARLTMTFGTFAEDHYPNVAGETYAWWVM